MNLAPPKLRVIVTRRGVFFMKIQKIILSLID